MANQLIEFMPIMGTGPKSSDPLGYSEARDAMRALLEENYNPVTFGGFMVAERWKTEQVEELAGFLDEIRSSQFHPLECDTQVELDIAGRFDGKLKSVNTDLASSILASAIGVKLFTHSGQDVPTKQGGVSTIDLIQALGWDPDPTHDRAARYLDRFGFSYMNQSRYAPGLDRLKSDRSQLGVRSFLNTIESMVDPANARVHLGAFYHLVFAKRVCDVFQRTATIDFNRVVMIQGIEGQVEFRPGYSLLATWENGELNDNEIKTAEFGLTLDREQLESIGPEASVSAELLRNLLIDNSGPDVYRDSVILNAAIRLRAAGAIEQLEAGISRSRELLGSPELTDYFNELDAELST